MRRRTLPGGDSRAVLSLRSIGAFVEAVLDVVNASGYGIWTVTGVMLAFNLDIDGRGDVLVPLLTGLIFIAAGHVGVLLSDLGPRRWRAAVRLLKGSQPRSDSLLAWITFVIMLALAGLVRGNNAFWATRAVSALLSLSCIATLLAIPTWRRYRSVPARLRRGGLLASLFCGGLWLWFMITLQHQPARPDGGVDPLLLGLLVVGLVAGLSTPAPPGRPVSDDRMNQWLVIVLAFAAPCALVTAASMWRGHSAMALAALLSCQIGLSINEMLHVARASPASRSHA